MKPPQRHGDATHSPKSDFQASEVTEGNPWQIKAVWFVLGPPDSRPIVFGQTEPNWIPDWEDLRGCAPDATGEVSSEVFVRRLRDDDWREPDWHPGDIETRK